MTTTKDDWERLEMALADARHALWDAARPELTKVVRWMASDVGMAALAALLILSWTFTFGYLATALLGPDIFKH